MKPILLASASAVALLVGMGPTWAGSAAVPNVQWTGLGDGQSWNDANNWVDPGNTNRTPAPNDEVSLTGPGPQTVTYDPPTDPNIKSLTIQADTVAAMTLQQSTGTLTVTGAATVGDTGAGAFSQSGGTSNFGKLVAGAGLGSIGTVTLTGGTMNDDAIVGDAGTGSFTNNGAKHNVTGNLILGNQSTGDGTYALLGGGTTNVTGGDAIVGNAGTGTFDHQNGTLTIGSSSDTSASTTSHLIVGAQDGSKGTYNLGSDKTSPGTATVTVFGNVIIGRDGGSTGNMTIDNGATLNVTRYFNPNFVNPDSSTGAFLGGALTVGGAGTGTLTHIDGTVTADQLTVGGAPDDVPGRSGPVFGTGVYNMTGPGAILNVGFGAIGYVGTGTMNQSDGAASFGFLAVGFAGSSPANPQGTYNLTGNGSVTAGSEVVGSFGNGTFNQGDAKNPNSVDTNPTHTVTGRLAIGDGPIVTPDGGSPPRMGTYNLFSGTLTTGTTSVGSQGIGIFNQSGGVHSAQTLVIGEQNPLLEPGCGGTCVVGGPAQGTYNLTGGTLQVSKTMTVGDAGDGKFNVSGGTTTVDTMQIGVNGKGSVTQTGGTVNAGFVDLSLPAGSGSSIYTISGKDSVLNVSDTFSPGGGFLNIAGGGTGGGKFDQQGGSVNVSDTVFVNGNLATGVVGEYALSDGTLAVGKQIVIGQGGSANFIQTGGTVTIGQSTPGGLVGGTLFVGMEPNGKAQYTIDNSAGNGDPSLSLGGNMWVGGNVFGAGVGHGTVDHSAGTVSVGTDLFLGGSSIFVFDPDPNPGLTGKFAVSSGNYNLSGTGILAVAGNELVGAGGVGSFVQSGTTTHTVGGNLTIADGDAPDPGGDPLQRGQSSYELKSGSLGVTGTLTVGNFGVGTFTQTGGSNTVGGDLVLGASAGSERPSGNGTYNYNGGTLSVTGLVVVGDRGIGTFNQNADLTLTNTLVLGRNLGGFGTYNLGKATLIDDVIVGDAGTGVFNNTAGGTHTVVGSLILGNQLVFGDGTYNLSGGSKTTVSDFTFVGAGGIGQFTNDASTHETGNMVLGQLGGSNGTYTLQNGGSLTVGDLVKNTGFLDVGGVSATNDSGGTGHFIQTGGTTQIGGALDIGRFDNKDGNTGTLDLSGGTMTVGTFADVGLGGRGFLNLSNDAALTIQGGQLNVGRDLGSKGTVTIADTATLSIDNGSFNIGNAGTGKVTQTGGKVSAGADENIGITGTGTYTQSGGSHTVAGDMILGFSAKSSGEYGISGKLSTLDVTSAGKRLIVGQDGTGKVTQDDGTVTAWGVSIGNGGGDGTYLLNGGTLKVIGTDAFGGTFVGSGAGTAKFDQGGGLHDTTQLTVGNALGGGPEATYLLRGGDVKVSGTAFIGAVSDGRVTMTADIPGVGTTFTSKGIVLGNSKGATGTFEFKGGDVTIGVDGMKVGADGSGVFTQSGGAKSLTVAGDIVIGGGALGSAGKMTVAAGTVDGRNIVNNDTFTFSGGGPVTLRVGEGTRGTLTNNAGATTTLSGPGTRTIDGNVANAGAFNVQGSGEVKGTFIQVSGSTVLGIGGPGGSDGSLTLALGGDFKGGTLKGNGSITGDVTIGKDASVGPGFSPGKITTTGAFHLAGTYFVDLGGTGAGEYDQLLVHGGVTIEDGTKIDVSLFGGFNPFAGDFFDILTGDTLVAGSIDFLLPALSGKHFVEQFLDSDGRNGIDTLRLLVVADVVSDVPEPGSLVLFGGGLLGLYWMRRRQGPRVVAARRG